MSIDPKTLRKQIRNVLQEMANEIVASEIGEKVMTKLNADLNARLDSIDKYCQNSLTQQDKRSRAIQSFVLGEVTGKIQNDLFNANVTIEAVKEVLADAGLGIEGFNEKIDAKKQVIADRIKREADEKMKAEMEKRAADAAPKEEAKQPEQSA